jgi:hypothetical protein
VGTTVGTDPFVALLSFQRNSPTDPWLLAFAGGFFSSTSDVTQPAVDSDGYLHPQTSSLSADPKRVHSMLARYWRQAKRTGVAPSPSPFAPGAWTTDFAATIGQYGQGRVGQNGLVAYYAYHADTTEDPVFTYPEGTGWEVSCSAVRVQKTFVGTTPSRGPFQDARRTNWGPYITPGIHTAMVWNELRVPCIEIPPSSSNELIRVLGAGAVSSTTFAIDGGR